MVANCATKFTATCLPMIGWFLDTMIFASTDKDHPAKFTSLKMLETVLSHLRGLKNKLVYCYSFFGILCNADQHFTKKVNITSLGWIVKAKYIIDRKKKSQSN